jgi:hypothetical protein
MADNGNPVGNTPQVRAEDLLPVRSRVSWGAIFAGAVVAMAAYLVLTLLGAAVGLSVSHNVRGETLGAGAAIWAIITTIASLFLGGWVTTQCAVGENKMEAVVHGVIMWGAFFAMILWMVAVGVRGGFNAMLGATYAGTVVGRAIPAEDWEAAARRAGVSQEQIDKWRENVRNAPARAREALEDPANRQAAADNAMAAAWWTLLGTVLSLAAAIAGALVGSGPSFRLLTLPAGGVAVGYERREYVNQR